MGKEKTLPAYPKVTVRDQAIVILYEDGSEDVWGYEANDEIAEAVAKDIELGLKCIEYTFYEVGTRFNQVMDDMIEFGLNPDYVQDIIYEGYSRIGKCLRSLGSSIKPVSQKN